MLNRRLSKLCKISIAALTAFSFLTIPYTTAQDVKRKKEWKVSAYIDGDSNLDQVSVWNTNQMEKIGSDETLDILVQLDRSEYQFDYRCDPDNYNYVPPDSKTRRYYIQKDDDMWKINSIRLEDFDKETNMGLFKEFEDFVKWVNTSDSKRRLFIIKGHGFGIMQPFEDITYGKGSDYSNNPLPVYTIDKVFDENLEDKLDVLIFDSCAMATIEVAYQLRKHANILIASEDLMWYTAIWDWVADKWEVLTPGIDYEKVLDFLNKNPHVDNETLGKFIVSSFYEKFHDKTDFINEVPVVNIIERQDATLSATNLDNLENFVSKFEKFSKTLVNRLEGEETRKTVVKALSKTLKEVQRYTSPDSLDLYKYIDLFDFLEKLDQNLDDKELNLSIRTLNKSDIIMDSVYNTPELKNSTGLTILFIEDFKSLAYYFENQPIMLKENISKLKEYYSKSDFAQKTGWDRVMELYQQYSD